MDINEKKQALYRWWKVPQIERKTTLKAAAQKCDAPYVTAKSWVRKWDEEEVKAHSRNKELDEAIRDIAKQYIQTVDLTTPRDAAEYELWRSCMYDHKGNDCERWLKAKGYWIEKQERTINFELRADDYFEIRQKAQRELAQGDNGGDREVLNISSPLPDKVCVDSEQEHSADS